MVVDLPLHMLRHRPIVGGPWTPAQAQRWNAYGMAMEAHEPAYLSGLSCRVLSADHKTIEHAGQLWFLLDHVHDGYSLEPAQHKHHWIVALDNGAFTCVPQDMILVHDASFTDDNAIPPIRRQDVVWSCES